MRNMKVTNAMRMNLFRLASFAMAMTAGHLMAQVFTTLHSFTGGSDGANPLAGVILSGSTLYGTAVFGGGSGYGTVFAINTNGTGFKVLKSFNGVNDEAYPISGLLLAGNTLYGASSGPGSSLGALFAVNTNGTGFTTLHVFTATSGTSLTNSDGGVVCGTLCLSGNTLYGAADYGGSGGSGNVFAVNTNGTGFTTLHTFTATSVPRNGVTDNPPYKNSDGAGPCDGIILSGNTLYGTTYSGGTYGDGTVFSLSFRPQLTIIPSETNVILSWPTNYAGFDYTGHTLQSTTNLGSSAAWNTNSPAPVVVNGQNTVTNPTTGTQQFFRLIQ